jgi:hypothetical protein
MLSSRRGSTASPASLRAKPRGRLSATAESGEMADDDDDEEQEADGPSRGDGGTAAAAAAAAATGTAEGPREACACGGRESARACSRVSGAPRRAMMHLARFWEGRSLRGRALRILTAKRCASKGKGRGSGRGTTTGERAGVSCSEARLHPAAPPARRRMCTMATHASVQSGARSAACATRARPSNASLLWLGTRLEPRGRTSPDVARASYTTPAAPPPRYVVRSSAAKGAGG